MIARQDEGSLGERWGGGSLEVWDSVMIEVRYLVQGIRPYHLEMMGC